MTKSFFLDQLCTKTDFHAHIFVMWDQDFEVFVWKAARRHRIGFPGKILKTQHKQTWPPRGRSDSAKAKVDWPKAKVRASEFCNAQGSVTLYFLENQRLKSASHLEWFVSVRQRCNIKMHKKSWAGGPLSLQEGLAYFCHHRGAIFSLHWAPFGSFLFTNI